MGSSSPAASPRGRSRSEARRGRTRSKSGYPDSRGRTRSKTGSPRSSRSTTRDRRRSTSRRRRSQSTRSRSRRRSTSHRRRSRSRSRSQSEELEGQRLHVADLDSRASKWDLEEVFNKYGQLIEIWMAKSVPCFAFVVFKKREDAYEACRAADGQDICGRRVRVSMARPRTRGRSRRGFDPNMRCYQCGERGHFSRDCPDTKYGYKRPPSPRYRSRGRGGWRSRSRSRGRRY